MHMTGNSNLSYAIVTSPPTNDINAISVSDPVSYDQSGFHCLKPLKGNKISAAASYWT